MNQKAISKTLLLAALAAVIIISAIGALYAFGVIGGVTITSTKTATTTITATANATLTSTAHANVTTTVTNVTTIYLTFTTTFVTVTNSTTRTLTRNVTSTSTITNTLFSTQTSTLAPAARWYVTRSAPNSSQWIIIEDSVQPGYVWTNRSGVLPMLSSTSALNRTSIGTFCTGINQTVGNQGACDSFAQIDQPAWAYNATYGLVFIHYVGGPAVNITIGAQGSSPPALNPFSVAGAVAGIALASGAGYVIYKKKRA